MKLRTFATIAPTLLGAALIGYGQEQQQDRGPASGSPAAEQQTGQPTGGRATGQENSGQQGNRPTAGSQGNRPGSPASGTNASQAQSREQARSNAKMDKNNVDRDGAGQSDMPLAGIPARAKDTLTSVTKDGKLDDQVTRMNQGGQPVFKATVNREKEEDLHIFVKEDGTVVKTEQKVDLESVPKSVRSTIDSKLGQDGSLDSKEVHRVISDEKTHYVIGKSDNQDAGKQIHIDNSGQVIQPDPNDQITSDRSNSYNTDRSSSNPAGGSSPDRNAADPSASPRKLEPKTGGAADSIRN